MLTGMPGCHLAGRNQAKTLRAKTLVPEMFGSAFGRDAAKKVCSNHKSGGVKRTATPFSDPYRQTVV